jgi:ketosteroid isomerase-like protein
MPMSLAENKALVRRYYEEMWNCWDFALADELLAEGLTFRGSLGVTVRGRDGFTEYMEAVRRAFPDFRNRVEELVAEGDKVVARLTYTGTHRGELFGIRPTGRSVTYAGGRHFSDRGRPHQRGVGAGRRPRTDRATGRGGNRGVRRFERAETNRWTTSRPETR